MREIALCQGDDVMVKPKDLPGQVQRYRILGALSNPALGVALFVLFRAIGMVALDWRLLCVIGTMAVVQLTPMLIEYRYEKVLALKGLSDPRCWNCEYNLTGLSQQGACPECGLSIEESTNLWGSWSPGFFPAPLAHFFDWIIRCVEWMFRFVKRR